jgi:hypothetical protein
MNKSILISILLLFPTAALGATIHVPAQYATLQAAIDAAGEGDIVLAAPGTYEERIDFKGKAILLISSHGPEATVIDGGYPPDSDFGSVVAFQGGEDENTALIGFTIAHGAGNEGLGGGIFIDGASPRIEDNIIRENTVGEMGQGAQGGGLYLRRSAALIRNNVIAQNQAWLGAGVFCCASDAVISGNRIVANKAAMSGGGIRCEGGHPSIFGNTFKENAAWQGAGLSSMASSPQIANNVFQENHAASFGLCGLGGAIACTDGSAYLLNNTFHGNFSDGMGGGLALTNASVSVHNSIFWNNEAPSGNEIWVGEASGLFIQYSNVQGGQEAVTMLTAGGLQWGPGMMDADPRFADAGPGDFHLLATSPCRDAGEHILPGLPVEDFEGDPRISGGLVDLGADEFHPHLYFSGNPFTGGGFEIKLIASPGTGPAHLFLGSDALNEPLRSRFGDWYLRFPVILLAVAHEIPENGLVLFLGESSPGLSPEGLNLYPTVIPMQALVGMSLLTNCCVIDVQ